MLLYFKPELRGLSQHLSRRDLLSVLQFSVLALIILPLLPNRNYGPYGALNPYQIWWMVVLISGVGLAGYAALPTGRATARRGRAGPAGRPGVLHCDNLDVQSPRARQRVVMPTAVTVIVLANLVVLVRLGVLAAVLAPGVLTQLTPMLLGGLVAGGLGALTGCANCGQRANPPRCEMTNPTELRTALGFGLMYGVRASGRCLAVRLAGHRVAYMGWR